MDVEFLSLGGVLSRDGGRELIEVELWAEIRRMHLNEGVPIKEVVRRTGVARNTVRAAVRSSEPPAYRSSGPRPSSLDDVDGEIRLLLKATPTMPASVIAERIGWDHGMTVLRDRVRELRPLFLPPVARGRTQYRPGERGQYDLWFPGVPIPVGAGQVRDDLPVFVATTCYSRVMAARMIPSRQIQDILGGHLHCLVTWGAVPREGVYDNEPAIGSWRNGRPQLTEDFQRFRGAFAMAVRQLEPAFPEGKGVTERNNGYLETSFLPGRTFAGVDDFNAQLAGWLTDKANRRLHATLRCRPIDRFAEDVAAMLPLPPVLPDVAWHHEVRLGRDHYVRFETNDYSVDPRVVGRRVRITADVDWVRVRCADALVAEHRRSLARHATITDPVHERLRYEMNRERSRLHAATADEGVEERDLAVYDQVAS